MLVAVKARQTMFKIDGNRIWLTRGDTAEFRPVIEDYESQEGDKVVFAAKRARNDEKPDIRLEVNAGENITFAHEDTVNLAPGSYVYDIKLAMANGNISTFASGKFELICEVDTDGNEND